MRKFERNAYLLLDRIISDTQLVLSKTERAALSAYKNMTEELESIKRRDPAAENTLEIALLYSGFHAVAAYRIAHKLHIRDYVMTARLISQTAKSVTGIEIHPAARIGKGLFIDHGSGVVIGETTEIGDNCTLYQGVTLGGTGKDVGKRHPTLGNNVMIGAGAKVLGPLTIGDNSKIAANAVVLSSVPANSTAVGIPARVVKTNDQRTQLDQVHMPDPVSQEFCKMRHRLDLLEKKISELEGAENNGENK